MKTYAKIVITFKDKYKEQFEVEMEIGFSTSTDAFWLFIFEAANHNTEFGMVAKAHGDIIEMKFIGFEDK